MGRRDGGTGAPAEGVVARSAGRHVGPDAPASGDSEPEQGPQVPGMLLVWTHFWPPFLTGIGHMLEHIFGRSFHASVLNRWNQLVKTLSQNRGLKCQVRLWGEFKATASLVAALKHRHLTLVIYTALKQAWQGERLWKTRFSTFLVLVAWNSKERVGPSGNDTEEAYLCAELQVSPVRLQDEPR